jgi:Flp pilus assembly protein TadG
MKHAIAHFRRKVQTRRESGQAMVELALIFPLMVGFVVVCFQFVILFLAYLSVMNAARDVARDIAVHPHQTDDTVRAALATRLPPNILPSRLTTNPLPPCPSLALGKCAGRTTGARLTVEMQYDASNLIFLPTQIGVNWATFKVPTSLPLYSTWWSIEPT